MKRLRILIPAAAAVVAAGGVSAWLLLSANSAVAVTLPSVDAHTARVCADLSEHLPKTVDGQSRVPTSPTSNLAAAWGQSPIVLVCGVATPAVITPGSSTYDPEALSAYVNGIAWLPVQVPDGWSFYAVEREVFVEVFIPSSYDLTDGNPGTDAVTDLSPAVLASTLTNQGKSGPDVTPAGDGSGH